MKKTMLILLMSVLAISCSKDDSSSGVNGLTSKEKSILGKWYLEGLTFQESYVDMSCDTCYWEFFPEKDENGVMQGMQNGGGFFFWWTEQNGELYVMLDAIIKVKSISDTKLVLGEEGMQWSLRR